MTKSFTTFFILGCLILLGFGCSQPATIEITDPETGKVITCPDVCADICAGRPEPDIPQACPLPACACDE